MAKQSTDFDLLKPIFQKNIWLLRVIGILMLILIPIFYIPISFWVLRTNHKELISDIFYDIKVALTTSKAGGISR